MRRLHVNLGSLVYVFFRDICGISPGDDVVPFRIFTEFTVSVPVSLRSGEGEGGDLCALAAGHVVSIKITYFGISSNVTDKHYFVE